MDMLAMTAVGSYYDNDALSERLRQSCYYSCVRLLKESKETNHLRYMRLFLCLSMYCTLDQPQSACRLISAALQIGRIKLIRERNITGDTQGEDEEYWRKIFRTVVFMECWHSYSLGYHSYILDHDIKYARFWTDSSHSIEASIQDQVSKIGFLAAEMSRDIQALPETDIKTIKNHTEKLDAWHRELPPMMHLSTLNSPHNTIFSPIQRRSILLMHMFFLSAVALLHRKLLVAIADSREAGTWGFDASQAQAYRYQEYCIIAAQQAARIASLLEFDGNIPKHSWVAIYQTFAACTILLFSAAQRLLHRSHDAVEDDLACARNCVSFLTWCSSNDSIAGQYLKIVQPIYDMLFAIKSTVLSRLMNSGHHAFTGEQHVGRACLDSQIQPATGKATAIPTRELLHVVAETRRLLLDSIGSAHKAKGNGGLMPPLDFKTASTNW